MRKLPDRLTKNNHFIILSPTEIYRALAASLMLRAQISKSSETKLLHSSAVN